MHGCVFATHRWPTSASCFLLYVICFDVICFYVTCNTQVAHISFMLRVSPGTALSLLGAMPAAARQRPLAKVRTSAPIGTCVRKCANIRYVLVNMLVRMNCVTQCIHAYATRWCTHKHPCLHSCMCYMLACNHMVYACMSHASAHTGMRARTHACAACLLVLLLWCLHACHTLVHVDWWVSS